MMIRRGGPNSEQYIKTITRSSQSGLMKCVYLVMVITKFIIVFVLGNHLQWFVDDMSYVSFTVFFKFANVI